MDPNSAEARAGLRFHGFGREKWNEVESERAVVVYWDWAWGRAGRRYGSGSRVMSGKAHQRSSIDERSKAFRVKDKNVG